jgi:predicted transcriptional regulator
MDRMAAKGLLTAEKKGKLTVFQSGVTREHAQRGELLEALQNAFSGALTPMVQCLLETGSVSARDLAELEALIKRKRKAQEKKP